MVDMGYFNDTAIDYCQWHRDMVKWEDYNALFYILDVKYDTRPQWSGWQLVFPIPISEVNSEKYHT